MGCPDDIIEQPDGTFIHIPTGACCLFTSGSTHPAAQCRPCVQRLHCVGDDCIPMLVDRLNTALESPENEFEQQVVSFIQTAFSWGLYSALPEQTWYQGQDCNDIGGFGACGSLSACCISACPDGYGRPGDESRCLMLKAITCGRKYVSVAQLLSQSWLWVQMFGRYGITPADRGITDRVCQTRSYLNPNCTDRYAERRIATSWHSGIGCRCDSVPDSWRTFGITSCLRRNQDNVRWEDVCAFVYDDIICQPDVAFPIAIDEQGFAIFYAGTRFFDAGVGAECRDVIADMTLTVDGTAFAQACVYVDQLGGVVKISVAELCHLSGNDVSGMYGDLEYAPGHSCGN